MLPSMNEPAEFHARPLLRYMRVKTCSEKIFITKPPVTSSFELLMTHQSKVTLLYPTSSFCSPPSNQIRKVLQRKWNIHFWNVQLHQLEMLVSGMLWRKMILDYMPGRLGRSRNFCPAEVLSSALESSQYTIVRTLIRDRRLAESPCSSSSRRRCSFLLSHVQLAQ